MTQRLIVTGGDAAGMSAASAARRQKGPEEPAIVAFDRSNYTSYSPAASRTSSATMSPMSPTGGGPQGELRLVAGPPVAAPALVHRNRWLLERHLVQHPCLPTRYALHRVPADHRFHPVLVADRADIRAFAAAYAGD